MWIAGGNANVVRNNRFYDNWRRGAMLFQVPDQFVCDDPNNQVAGCDPTATVPATSYRNQFYDNKMGVAPNGSVQRNGVDFWWDQGGISIDPTLNTRELLVQQHGPGRHGRQRHGPSLAERHPAEQPAVRLCRQPIGGRHERAGRPRN